MTIFTVSTTAELTAALKHVLDGDTILMNPGTYSNIAIVNYYGGNVMITSADPSNPAVLTDMKVNGSSGLTFSNLEFYDNQPSNLFSFYFSGDSNITLTNLSVHGLDNIGSGEESSPLMIRSSTNFTVSDSEFYNAKYGMQILDNTNLTIDNNYFHDIRSDGIRGGGNSDVVISQNFFTNFYPATDDHPDAIQFWTTNTTTSASNIVIDGNLIVRGDGDHIQGIFFRDQVGGLPYFDVSITNNIVLGEMYNGIVPGGVETGLVAYNTVIGYSDMKSWISVIDSVGLSYVDNTATWYSTASGSTTVAGTDGNTISSVLLSPTGDSLVTTSTTSGTLLTLTSSSVSTTVSDQTFINSWLLSHPDILFGQGDTFDSMRAYFGVAVSSTQIIVGNTSFTRVLGTDGVDSLTAKANVFSVVQGGYGNDKLYSATTGSSYLLGGLGDDTYVIRTANAVVIEDAGGGTDLVSSYISYALTANVEKLTLVSTTGLTGTGNELDNVITGSAGNDMLYGLTGNDTIHGGVGNDIIYGGDGNDILYGDAGIDTIYGGAGDDVIHGGDGNDIIFGNDGNDIIYADGGDDTVNGGAGDDRIYGVSGNVVLNGGDGNDVIEGGTGTAIMTGGAGADYFVFRQTDVGTGYVDTITDFTHGDDKIQLNLIDAKTSTTTNDTFSFIGTASFHNVAGELRYVVQGADSYVYGDVNGDGVADFSILLKGVTALVASDFVL